VTETIGAMGTRFRCSFGYRIASARGCSLCRPSRTGVVNCKPVANPRVISLDGTVPRRDDAPKRDLLVFETVFT